MALDYQKLLDDTGWQILELLQQEARITFAELGRRVGLSLPAVAERVRRMEEAGIINGYRTVVDLAKIGLPVMAFIHLKTPSERYPALIAHLRQMPQVVEGHHIAGSDAFILKVVAASIPQLETIITRFSAYGQTTTSIVLSSPVINPVLTREAAG